MGCQQHRKVPQQGNQIHQNDLQDGSSEQEQPPQLHRRHTKHCVYCQNAERSNHPSLLRTSFQQTDGQHQLPTWSDVGSEEQESLHCQKREERETELDRSKTDHMG